MRTRLPGRLAAIVVAVLCGLIVWMPSLRAAAPLDGQVVFYSSHGLDLKAYVYKPDGPGPFPVFIWNHGSEKAPMPGARFAQFLVPKGMVVFAPIRSGQGDNPGTYILDAQKRLRATLSPAGFAQLFALHERANDDVVAAMAWIRRQAYVDPARVVVAGGSFGGIQALLTAERDAREHLGVTCVVAMAPAAESWVNPNWAPRLGTAVGRATAPIFLMQANNDYSLAPSRVLGPRIEAKGGANRYRIFPDHGDPADHAQGHGAFFSDAQAWATDMLGFLHDCGALR